MAKIAKNRESCWSQNRCRIFSLVLAFLLVCVFLALRIAIQTYDDEQQACNEHLHCEMMANKSTQGEFKSTIKMFKDTDATYNGCKGTYETEYVVYRKQIDITRNKILYPDNKPLGIMAVVQDMNLYYVDESLQCLDYVQLSPPRFPGEESLKTCGAFKGPEEVKRIIGPVSAISTSSKLQVSYSLFSNREISAKVDDRSLNIKFTSFYACPDSGMLNEIGENTMRRCSEFDGQSCIPSEYFCDGVINCADFGYGVGWDERNCDATEISMKLNILRDDSSELSLNDAVIVTSHAKTSLRLTIIWSLMFVVMPILLFIISIVLTFNIYYRVKFVTESYGDLLKLYTFLARTGLTVNRLKNLRLVKCTDPATVGEQLKHPLVETVKVSTMGQVIWVDPKDPDQDKSLMDFPTFNIHV